MKKIFLFLQIFLTAGALSIFLLNGCGGGGGTSIVEPQVTVAATATVSATPVFTANPTASATAGATSTAVASATVTVTAAPTSTSPSVTGKVTSMFSSSAVSGATVTLEGETTNTDAQGNFLISGTTGRMEISGSGYYTYSFPVNSSPLEVLLAGTDMNNTSYSSYFIGGVSKRWLITPKFKINSNVPTAAAAAIKNIIINEVSALTGNFIKVSESEILTTSATEPEQGEVILSMDSTATNSFTELSYSGNEIVASKIIYRDEDLDLDKYSLRTIRHELGHMVGFNHPFAVLGWESADLPISIMNYIDWHNKSSFEYSPFDIQAGIRKYHRAAGNKLPDTDPDLPVIKHKKIQIIKIIL